MGNFIDLTGQRFGRWTVIKKAEIKKHKKILWLCQCDCGNFSNVATSNLNNGTSKSCGCLNEEICRERMKTASKGNNYAKGIPSARRKPFGEGSFNKLFRSYKSNANKRNLEFLLSIENFAIITKSKCFYCNKEPYQFTITKGGYGGYIYNGIDRIDSSKGYTEDNVVSCCWECNKAKNNTHQSDFYSWIDRVYHNLKQKGEI